MIQDTLLWYTHLPGKNYQAIYDLYNQYSMYDRYTAA